MLLRWRRPNPWHVNKGLWYFLAKICRTVKIGFPKIIPKNFLSRDHSVSCCVLGKQKYFLMKRASVLRKMNQCERYLAIFAHGEYGPNLAQMWPKRGSNVAQTFCSWAPTDPKNSAAKSLTHSLFNNSDDFGNCCSSSPWLYFVLRNQRWWPVWPD